MKKILMAVMALVGVAGLALFPGEVYAGECPNGGTYEHSIAECGVNAVDGGGSDEELMTTVNRVINIVIGIVAIVAVVVMIIGGVYFIISQGDSAKITRARNTILYGLVGLVVSLLAFAIVNFVLSSVFSGSATPASGGEGGGESLLVTDSEIA